MTTPKEIIGHCPWCNSVVVRGLEGEINAGKPVIFGTTCPSPKCQKRVSVSFGAVIRIEPVVEKR